MNDFSLNSCNNCNNCNNCNSCNISILLKDTSYIEFLTYQIKGVLQCDFNCQHLSLNNFFPSGCCECTCDFIKHSTFKNYFENLYQWFKQIEIYPETKQCIDHNEYFFHPINLVHCLETIQDYLKQDAINYFNSVWLDNLFKVTIDSKDPYNVFKYFKNNDNSKTIINSVFCTLICKYGNLETLQWLYKCKEKTITLNFNEQNVIFNCVHVISPNVLSWLFSINLLDQIDNKRINKAFINVCGHGIFETVDLLLKLNGNRKINKTTINEDAFMLACVNNRIEVVKLLLSLKDDKKVDQIYIEMAFRKICNLGIVGMVRLFLELKDDQQISKDIINQRCDDSNSVNVKVNVIIDACENGHIEIVKMLIELDGERQIKDNYIIDNVFVKACEKGHIEIVKMLLDLEENRKIQYNTIERAFYLSCKIGQVRVIKLLLELKDYHTINVNFDEYCSFLIACENGHIEVVKLLLELKGENQFHDCNVFKKALIIACKEDYMEIIDLLMDHLINIKKIQTL